MKQFYFALIALFACRVASAQYTFTLYNTTNTPMPTNDINGMAIDGSNVKYFANAGGLVRFDGATWTVYDTVNSNLPGLPVFSVDVNPIDNSVWVLSGNNDPDLGETLSRFDGTGFTQHLTPACTIWDPTVSGPLGADPSGAAWVDRDEFYTCHNIVRFDGSAFIDLPFPDGDADYWNSHFPNAIKAISATEAWIGTMSGLLHYNSGTWTYYDNVNSELPDEAVTCVRRHGNTMWFSTNQGFVSFDGANWQVYSNLTVPEFQGMIIGGCVDFDSQGRLWTAASTWDEPGIVSFDGSIWTFYNTTNSNLPSAGTIHVDLEDNIWVRNGTWGLAVLQSPSSITGTSEIKPLRVFPNPTADALHIENLATGATVVIYNALNQRVTGWSQNGSSIDVSDLYAGCYTLRIVNNKCVSVATFYKAF